MGATGWLTMGVRRFDVPVSPDAPTARRWLQDELADPKYRQRPSLLDRFLEWLSRIDGNAVVPPGVVAVIILVVIAVVILISFLVVGPIRGTRTASSRSAVVLGDDARTSAQMRAAANAATHAGDYSTAVLERFRAVVRSMEERVILDERPGRTADEAAAAGSVVLPDAAASLSVGARLFDDVCYGKAEVSKAADDTLRQVDEAVLAARPTQPDGAQVVA